MNKAQASIASVGVIAAIAAGIYFWKYQEWGAIPKAREPLISYLKDPGSAQFRNERISTSGALCGEVNAKNSMGGYVGFRRYILAGPESNYIEENGPIGNWSAADITMRLNEENAILRRFAEAQKEFPGLPIPSESERADMAIKSFFGDKWKELCDSKAV